MGKFIIGTTRDPVIKEQVRIMEERANTANDRIKFLQKQVDDLKSKHVEDCQPQWRTIWERCQEMGTLPEGYTKYGHRDWMMGVALDKDDDDYGNIYARSKGSGPDMGKTLTAYVTAALCREHGWTFIYLDRVSGLKSALRVASLYGPAVIFAEDIDRVVAGERSVKIDDILNQIDGIEAKAQEVIVILTTNYVDKIERAMLRPGRLDSVITVSPPDATAAEKLVRIYGRNLIDPAADLSVAGKELAGQIPAVIREVVERAKLYAISRLETPDTPFTLEGTDIVGAAQNMKRHLELMAPHKVIPLSEEAAVGASFSKIVQREVQAHINGSVTQKLDKIIEAVQ